MSYITCEFNVDGFNQTQSLVGLRFNGSREGRRLQAPTAAAALARLGR